MNDLKSEKEELRKQHEELARGLTEINNPKSPEEVLTNQIVADYRRSSARDKDRKRFFRK